MNSCKFCNDRFIELFVCPGNGRIGHGDHSQNRRKLKEKHRQTKKEKRMDTTNDNAIASPEQVKKATAAIKKVRDSLPLASLTPAERIEYRTKRGNRFSL